MANPEVDPVYLTPQPESNPTPGGDGGTRLFINNNYTMSGENPQKGGEVINIKTEKVANFKIMRGTSTSVWGYLSKLKEFMPNGPHTVDSRDGKVKIHNYNFNQNPIAYYVYQGGNGELIELNVSSKKVTKHVDAATTSHIDPKKKTVNTTVTQVHTNTEAPRGEFGRLPNGRIFSFKPQKSFTPKDLKGIMNEKHPGDYRKHQALEEKVKKIKNAKSEREARAEAAQNYQITAEDCDRYFKDKHTQFYKLLDEAKKTGNPEPLLKSGSMTGLVVKRQISIRTKVNPETYSDNYMTKQQIAELTKGKFDGAKGGSGTENIATYQWNNGYNHLRNMPGIIVIPDKKNGYQYKPGDMVEVIMDKVVDVEIDGARVFAAATPHQISSAVAESNLKKSSQEQITGNLKVIGRPELESSKVIYVSGVSRQDSGKWYIKKVKHSFSSMGYFCDIECIRNGTTAGVSSVTTKINTRSILTQYKGIAKAALKNGTYNDDSEFKQEFKKYIKENPDEADKSLYGVVDEKNPKSMSIIPASQDGVNITTSREAMRRR